MVIYDKFDIVFQEIPNEVSLAFTLKNCPFLCKGCHSANLRESTGKELTASIMQKILDKYTGEITNVLFLGGDRDLNELIPLLKVCKKNKVKTSLYSGKNSLYENIIPYLDYYKIGSYDEVLGGLNSKTTNQRLYKIDKELEMKNITYKFWR